MNIESRISGLFPIPLYRVNISNYIEEEEIEELLKLNGQNLIKNTSNHRSEKSYLLKNFKNMDMKNVIQEHIDIFLHEIWGENKDRVSLQITQSWLNFNKTEDTHHKHFHSNSILSGVFYIRCDDKTGDILFYRPGEYYKDFGGEIVNKNIYNYNYMNFTPKKYDLFLFPSKLYHSVNKNESEETRVSLAFNTFYKGTLGSEIHLTELEIL